MADYYEILGVDKSVSDADLKKAFRKMAHKYHPDKKGGDEAKFKEVNEAYQVLSDSSKRAQYDQFGSAGPGGQGFGGAGQGFGGFGGGAGGFDFGGGQAEDMFSQFFGGGGGGARGGRDMQVHIDITFAEMITGVEKKITLNKSVQCEKCAGSGGDPGASQSTCGSCSGTGRVRKVMQTILGNIAQEAICDECRGKGKIYEKRCDTCAGDGTENKSVEGAFDIPAGIQSGQTIAFGGKGMAGESGAPAGDLLVNVSVLPDERFEREGNNILSTREISYTQAVLGDKVSIETVEGSVKMKIPAGTQSGEIFRIKSKGVPRLQSVGRGDHMVTVQVVVPTKLSKEEKKLIEKLAEVK